MLNLLVYSDPVNIFLSLLAVAAAVFLIWFFRRSVKNAKSQYIEDSRNTEFTPEKFDALLERKVTHDRKANFTIMQVEIQDIETLKRTYGEIQYENALSSLLIRLKELLGSAFKVFKYSQDSIYIYSKNALSGAQLTERAKNVILESQKATILAGALSMEFDVSVGIVTYPGCGTTVEEIKQNLLIALVTAKKKGFNTYGIYDAQIGNKQTEEYKYYTEIKNAINNKEFTLHYQAIVDIKSLEVFAAEALIRWEHKTMGTLSPASFLPIMEKTGDINWVGFWSLEQLIKQQQQWNNQYPDRKLLLSMNLSPKQLLNPGLIEELRRIVKRYRVQTSDFIMEIVQFAMFDKIDVVTDNIRKLSQMGFRIAVDNFGMEFSTLQLLDSYKIDYIKLDKSFIAEAASEGMSKSILQMLIKYSSENKIRIIAEGIENAELLEQVKQSKIGMGQGYHFSRPKKNTEFIQDVILTPWKD